MHTASSLLDTAGSHTHAHTRIKYAHAHTRTHSSNSNAAAGRHTYELLQSIYIASSNKRQPVPGMHPLPTRESGFARAMERIQQPKSWSRQADDRSIEAMNCLLAERLSKAG